MDRIYLDHNATTPVDPEVVDEMLPLLRDGFGNPSSVHRFGQDARRAMDLARERVARLLGADPAEIVFTSGGTEADNHAVRGLAEARAAVGDRIVASAVEHPAVFESCRRLERAGLEFVRIAVDRSGVVDLAAARAAISPATRFVSVMLANNETGAIQPVREIAVTARAMGVPVHTDAVQAAGRIPIDVRDLGADLLSISSHKLHGPKGVGALWIRRGLDVPPLLSGGHHERNRRAGTENVPGIAGFGRACELALERLDTNQPKIAALRDRLEAGIAARFSSAVVNGPRDRRLPNTLHVSFPGASADVLVVSLDVLGIAVSTGAACSEDSPDASHVLLAMGVDERTAKASLRFSLGPSTTAAQIDATLDALARALGPDGKGAPALRR